MDIKKCAFVGLQNAVKKIEIWYEFDSWEKVIQKLNLKLLWENIWHLFFYENDSSSCGIFPLFIQLSVWISSNSSSSSQWSI